MRTTIVLLSLCLTIGCIPQSESKEKKGRKSSKESMIASPGVNVVQKWDLPAQLREVSGIAYMDPERFACIQDEDATIFIYNTTTQSIEREIPFGDPGDYEGIALVGSAAYVVRSDGMIFHVHDIRSAKSKVSSYQTPLTVEHNIEGLCYDQEKHRLLLAVKDSDPGSRDYKGIYEFDLRSNTLSSSPVYRIVLNDERLKAAQTGKKEKPVRPSGIVRHPAGDDLYILDGPASGLLVMDRSGKLKQHYHLGGDFAKPEGITFSPAGEMYVSNEGKKKPANIMKVKIDK